MLLADFGAEVIKIEEPDIGDYARSSHPKIGKDSAVFHSLNRNKKSVCLNLKSQEGKDTFLKLVETADVVVESFRPGVMERLGLDYERLKKINPGLIYCAITGYGQTGPYANLPGHDINYISVAGLLSLMGEKNGKPIVPATQIADIGGGALPAVIGISFALIERAKSGIGQLVDISMLDGVISWLQTVLPDYLLTEVSPKRGEPVLSGGYACYSTYETKDKRWLSVGALEPKFWEVFCRTIKKEEFIPLLEAPLHEQHRLKYEIQNVMLEKTQSEWLALFSDTESCVTPILNFEEMIHDPHVIERDMIQAISYKSCGTYKQIGIPIKLSKTPGKIQTQAPTLGEHTHSILEELKAHK